MTDDEIDRFQYDMEGTLKYVQQVEEVVLPADLKPEWSLTNIARNDIPRDVVELYNDDILDTMPKRDSRYLQVQKILDHKE